MHLNKHWQVKFKWVKLASYSVRQQALSGECVNAAEFTTKFDKVQTLNTTTVLFHQKWNKKRMNSSQSFYVSFLQSNLIFSVSRGLHWARVDIIQLHTHAPSFPPFCGHPLQRVTTRWPIVWVGAADLS